MPYYKVKVLVNTTISKTYYIEAPIEAQAEYLALNKADMLREKQFRILGGKIEASDYANNPVSNIPFEGCLVTTDDGGIEDFDVDAITEADYYAGIKSELNIDAAHGWNMEKVDNKVIDFLKEDFEFNEDLSDLVNEVKENNDSQDSEEDIPDIERTDKGD